MSHTLGWSMARRHATTIHSQERDPRIGQYVSSNAATYISRAPPRLRFLFRAMNLRSLYYDDTELPSKRASDRLLKASALVRINILVSVKPCGKEK
jgi:hypothetical protein